MHKYYRTKDVDKAVKIAQRAKEAETYVVWGRKYKSVSMSANEYGIKRSTIFKKMEQGNTLEEALTEILKKEVIFFQGKKFHGLTELSCYYGQDVSLVWERLAYGMNLEEALFSPIRRRNKPQFPKFIVSEETVAVVEVQNTTGDREYLYLPTDICSMDKVKERLQVREYRELKVTEVENLRLPDTLVPIPEDINEVQQLTLFNEMCRKVRRFQEAELKQLAAAVQFTGLFNSSNVAYIATHLNEFEINPTVHNDEEYGKYLITESGLFEVDELLLPHINYAAFGADKKAGTFEVSGYVDDGFVGVTRPIEEYSQYKGEFADPLEITEEGLEKFCLFSPLIANLNMRGIAEGELYGSDLVQYLEIIEEAIERERCEGEEARGLMHYFDESREVAAKVVSAHPKVADVDGELYGVLECKIRDPLTEEEIKILKDFWTGQMSDGWGEGFEQQPLTVEDGEIYISFWSRKSFWSVMTERELIGEQQVQNTETQMHI